MSPLSHNLYFYAECTTQKFRLDESQAGIKTFRRNINDLRHGDDTTLMAEREEELKSLLMRGREDSDKVDLKLNIQNLRSWHPVTSWQIDGNNRNSDVFYLLGFQNPWGW